MSFMDAALEAYKAPSADDLDISLPPRREPKKEVADTADAPELGQHGGVADGSPAATDAHSDSASSAAAPEPVPQRDDPDDGEHTDSNEGMLAARAAKAAARDTEGDREPEEAVVEVEPEVEPAPEPEPEPAPVAATEPVSLKQQLAGIAGQVPQTFQKTGYSSGGVETLTVKPFPQVLVDTLRLSLAPAVGGAFAESISAPALITAFLMAKTGVELDVDANTAVAVDVFRQVDPRLLTVEDKIDNLMGDVSQLANAMKLSLNRVADTGKIVDGLEFGVAYLVADRVAGLTTADIDETNVDVTQKKVLTARESIRAKSKEQRTIELQREGRRAK